MFHVYFLEPSETAHQRTVKTLRRTPPDRVNVAHDAPPYPAIEVCPSSSQREPADLHATGCGWHDLPISLYPAPYAGKPPLRLHRLDVARMASPPFRAVAVVVQHRLKDILDVDHIVPQPSYPLHFRLLPSVSESPPLSGAMPVRHLRATNARLMHFFHRVTVSRVSAALLRCFRFRPMPWFLYHPIFLLSRSSMRNRQLLPLELARLLFAFNVHKPRQDPLLRLLPRATARHDIVSDFIPL